MRLNIIHSQQIMAGVETNPPQAYQLALLEEIARRLGTAPTWIHGKRDELGLNGAPGRLVRRRTASARGPADRA